jgi:hypothetical protein
VKIYVFGHEFSQVIVGILSGANVKKIKIGQKSGSVF